MPNRFSRHVARTRVCRAAIRVKAPHGWVINCHFVHHVKDAGHGFDDATIPCIFKILEYGTYRTSNNDIGNWLWSWYADPDFAAYALTVKGTETMVTAYTDGGPNGGSGGWYYC